RCVWLDVGPHRRASSGPRPTQSVIVTRGRRGIRDPLQPPATGGSEPVADPAVLVIVSHENDRYHSHLGQIVPPFEVLRALEIPPGGAEVCGIRFEAVRVFETPERKPEDEVTIVHFRPEGLHGAFLGDLAHPLSEEELAPLGGAEVVLAAAGGPPTIDLAELPPLLDAIGPRLVLPMHYKTPRINLNILPLQRFLEVVAGTPVDRPGSSTLEVT